MTVRRWLFVVAAVMLADAWWIGSYVIPRLTWWGVFSTIGTALCVAWVVVAGLLVWIATMDDWKKPA